MLYCTYNQWRWEAVTEHYYCTTQFCNDDLQCNIYKVTYSYNWKTQEYVRMYIHTVISGRIKEVANEFHLFPNMEGSKVRACHSPCKLTGAVDM